MTSRLHKQWNKIVIRYTLFRFTCFHGTQPFGDQTLSFDFNAEISSIESSRRIPRMCNDHVSLYSEETNAETNVVLVPYLCRIVPHILSARFPTLYMGKRTAIKILLRKRQFSVRFVSYHARSLPIKIFFSFEAMSRYTSIRNKKHFDFCSLIRIFAIRLKKRSFKWRGRASSNEKDIFKFEIIQVKRRLNYHSTAVYLLLSKTN